MGSGVSPSTAYRGYRDDEVLVRECLLGTASAWSELIDKYKNLIYSIPVKYGLSTEDAKEIFQAVSFALLNDLPQLREPRALSAWLIRLTARKCARLRHEQRSYVSGETNANARAVTTELPDLVFQQVEREQIIRETLAEASAECRQLIHLLFFENPPLSYDAAAEALGLAKGSIGATRMRCLEKLRRSLEKKGFL